MYDLYKEKCSKENINPEKYHYYHRIFTTEFNLGFHIPKKDKCDTCEEHKTSEDATTSEYEDHIKDKSETKSERDKDSKENTPVVCFDLENVISCPRADVSNFFYKRKINTYNLTAPFSLYKKGYNAVWTEVDDGRGGNEIASALIAILNDIVKEYPTLEKLCLWSNSCVPQNKNYMVTALKIFLYQHLNLKQIEHKFCTPGHSNIQEVSTVV